MKVNWDKVDTGGYKQAQPTLRRRISALVRREIPFKIGITNKPDQRASDFRANGAQFDEMIVLYQTNAKKFITKLEKDLIDYYEGYAYNVAKGGGKISVSDPPFYLYVVRTKLR